MPFKFEVTKSEILALLTEIDSIEKNISKLEELNENNKATIEERLELDIAYLNASILRKKYFSYLDKYVCPVEALS